MTLKKNHLRLIVGASCIFLAVLIAVLDFMDAVQFLEAPQAPAPIDIVARKIEEETDVCEIDGEPCQTDETLQVQRGDTLFTVLARADIDPTQATDVIEQLKKVFNPKDLRPEHELYISYLPLKKGPIKRDLKSLYIRPTLETEILVERNDSGAFVATKSKKELKHQTRVAKGIVQNSLYIDAGKQNVPPKILHEMIQAFSYDVDFQRSFQGGEGFGVMYDTAADPDSLREEAGQMQFAVLQLQDKTYKIYRFKNVSGIAGYYNEKGESIKKGLLRTPIDGARISSTFGNRRHPVLGYTKMHKGVDFAAPPGTPIMAAGDGVVVKAEPWGAYGNYVQIRHNQEFSTAYAHMRKFAKGVRPGSRVHQGQTIGYVGSTGRTTGPHLHYELLRFNKQINPNSIKMLPAGKLGGGDLSKFKAMVAKIDRDFDHYEPPAENSLTVEVVEEASDESEETTGKKK